MTRAEKFAIILHVNLFRPGPELYKGGPAVLDLGEVFVNLVELFLLIGVGYGAVRLKVMPASGAKLLTSLLMNVTLPATVITSLHRPFDGAFLRSGVLMMVLGAGCILLYIGLGAVMTRPFRVPEGRRGMWVLASTFSNNGFMGFPIALALFGEEGLALAVFLGVPFNLLAYTIGAKLVRMDSRGGEGERPISWRSLIVSVINVSTLLGLLVYVAQIPIPVVIEGPLVSLANMTTPLSMLVIGMNLSGGSLRTLLRDRDVFSAAFMRLLALPLATWALLKLLPIRDPLVAGVLLIIMSMPCAALTSLLAEAYDGDREFAAELVFLSSLLCLVTIPLISLLV